MGCKDFPQLRKSILITPRELTCKQVTTEAIELRFFPIRRLSLEVKDFVLIEATSQRMINWNSF